MQLVIGGMMMEQYKKAVEGLEKTHMQMLRHYHSMDMVGRRLISMIRIEDVPGTEGWKMVDLHEDRILDMQRRQAEFSKAIFEQYREAFDCLTEDGHLSVRVIQRMATAYLEAWLKVNTIPVWVRGQAFYCIKNAEIKRLANLATAAYLEHWLSEDRANFQTPYNIYLRPFEPLGTRTDEPLDGKDQQKSKREIGKRKRYHDAVLESSRIERRIPGRSPYLKRNQGNQMDLINAAGDYARREGKLDIISLLVERKHIMTLAEDKRIGLTTRLMEVCLRYQEFICETDRLRTGKTDNLKKKKQFVATSMLLHQIEREMRFHLHAGILNRKINGTIDPGKYNEDGYDILFCSYKGIGRHWIAPRLTLPRLGDDLRQIEAPYDPIDDAADILDIDAHIDAVFSVGDRGMAQVDIQKHATLRMILWDMSYTLMAVYPPAKQHSWTEEDFYQAAKFYREDYPVTKELLKITFPSADMKSKDYRDHEYRKKFYQGFVSHYQELEKNPNSSLAAVRQAYANRTK